ncbi:hypothetical protein GGF50DRAFT_18412, partial [Schizophyllum commune]
TEADTHMQIAFADQQRLDGQAAAAAHADSRKAIFDRRVLKTKPGEVIFEVGELVQVFDTRLDETLRTERKVLPQWSGARRIRER